MSFPWYVFWMHLQLPTENHFGMGAGTSQVVLSADYAAVRVDGQVILHPYDPNFNVPAGRDDKRFLHRLHREGQNVTWVSMTNDFLVYGTSRGFVHYFYIKQVRLGTALSTVVHCILASLFLSSV